MAVEPSTDAVQQVIMITSILPDQATKLLKMNNGDTAQAINAYFENPGVLVRSNARGGLVRLRMAQEENSWDMNIGPYPEANPDVPTFQIDATDSEPQMITGTAPSRPNSRMSHSSHRETIDLGPEYAAGEKSRQTPKRIKLKLPEQADASKSMSAEQRFQHDYKRAIELSMAPGGQIPGQESGITMSTAPRFGPANRDYYEESDWAMVRNTNTTSQEIILQPEAENRKRLEGEPAFLRPSDQTGYLSALLTILHAIPLAREALLFRSQTAEDYGSDPEWWNGTPITLSKVVSMEHGQWKPTGNYGESLLQSADSDDDGYTSILRDLQRLMAFLDMTKRAYGSTDALATHDGIRAMGDPNSMVVHFLESWVASVERPLQNIFATRATKRNQVGGGLQEETCLLLDVDVEPEHGQTLYDVVDHVIWSDQPDQELDEVWFDNTATVFTIRLRLVGQSDKGLDVKIPASWYPGRYFHEHLDDAREVRERKLEVIKEIERIDEMMERHSKFRSAAGESVGVKELLQSATNTIEKNFSDRQVNGVNQDHDMDAIPLVSNAEIARAVEELKNITDSISRKLEALQSRKERAVDTLRELTKSLTARTKEYESPKYTLRGVSTKPHITYVLRRAEMGDESSTDTIDNEWQWWRISFSKDDAKKPSQDVNKSEAPAPPPEKEQASTGWEMPVGPVSEWKPAKAKEKPCSSEHLGYTVAKVREVEVLKAAREEHSTVLLVYASSDAVSHSESWPENALKEFVKTDNEFFDAELAGDDSPQTIASSTFDSSPSSPSKRKRVDTSSEYTTNGVDITQHLEPVFRADQHLSPTRGFDERIPVSLIDAEFGEMTNIEMSDSAPAPQEMQEKSGGGLLSRGGSRFGRSGQGSGSMDRIGEEVGEDDMEISRMECVE